MHMLLFVLLMACEAPSPPIAEPETLTAPVPPPPAPTHLEVGNPNAEAVIVAMHGLGDRPESFARLFAGMNLDARIIVPAAPIRYGEGYSWFSSRSGIPDAAEGVVALIEQANLPSAPVVTGFSQGGMLALSLAVNHPDAIHGAVPMGGALDASLWPAQRSTKTLPPPIVAFHGEADDRVLIAPLVDALTHLQGIGWPARLRSYAGIGHTISRQMRADMVTALADMIAPCEVLSPTVTTPLLLNTGEAVDLMAGSLVRPTPVGSACPEGTRRVEVLSRSTANGAPVGALGCVSTGALFAPTRLATSSPKKSPGGEAPARCSVRDMAQYHAVLPTE